MVFILKVNVLKFDMILGVVFIEKMYIVTLYLWELIMNQVPSHIYFFSGLFLFGSSAVISICMSEFRLRKKFIQACRAGQIFVKRDRLFFKEPGKEYPMIKK